MPYDNIELRESKSDLMTSPHNGKDSKGCTLSLPVAFLFLLLAVLLSVGVGLIVFFATGNNQVKCADADVSYLTITSYKK